MDNIIYDSISFVMSNSVAIAEIVQAIMEEETGEMNVKKETTIVAVYVCLVDQFVGFCGSSGQSHVT